MIKRMLHEKPVSFCLRIMMILLAAIPIFYMAGLSGSIKEYPWAIGFSVLGIIAEVLLFLLPDKKYSDYIMIGGAAVLALAFSFFLMGGVLSIADYIAGVNFWGDATQFSSIVTYGVMLFGSACLSVVSCYMD